MTARKDEVWGLILAGGRSRRFGRDKARATLDGEALVVRAARVVGEVLPVGVVGPPGLKSLWESPPAWVEDLETFGGPLGAVVSAWRTWQRPLVVVACDLPALTAEVVAQLAAPLGSAAARVPNLGGRQWLCAHYGAAALAAMDAAWEAGERSLRGACAGLALEDGGPWDAAALADTDTPEALAALGPVG